MLRKKEMRIALKNSLFGSTKSTITHMTFFWKKDLLEARFFYLDVNPRFFTEEMILTFWTRNVEAIVPQKEEQRGSSAC